ncbi:PH domain-containing protein [Lysobacter yangpyeongensis]|uniref:PH domain-containing protein n=1 Tax=Lysobacter yangpyeongensis TaxID=346182 RepID=A0ABW0SME5_9GAMM
MENAATAAAPAMADWQPLPARARWLFALSRVWIAAPAAFAGFVVGEVVEGPSLLTALGAALLFAIAGLWLGLRQFRHVAWRLDDDGLAIRRGRMFQRETRVPLTRVQHLDLRRGPLQRRRRLATLAVHTAGTRHSAVTLAHLDAADAERLRDILGRQIDRDDDDA